MDKRDILKKVLEVIQGSMTDSDSDSEGALHHSSGQIDGGAANSTDEQAIISLSWEFAKALNDRNFECLDGRAEYHFYTLDHLIELLKNNDEQNTINAFNEHKIHSKFEDCEFISITFSEDREQAEVVYNVRTCVESANDSYLKQLNKKNNKKNRISAGTPFNTKYQLVVKKERGTWKVDKFEASEENIRTDTNS